MFDNFEFLACGGKGFRDKANVFDWASPHVALNNDEICVYSPFCAHPNGHTVKHIKGKVQIFNLECFGPIQIINKL